MDQIPAINQLVIVTLDKDQFGELTRKLIRGGFHFTEIDSTGGFLQRATATIVVGINASQYDDLINTVRTCCKRRRIFVPTHVEPTMMQMQPLMIEAEIGGAAVFTLDIERFLQL